MSRTNIIATLSAFLVLGLLAACSDSDGPCASDSDCATGQYCVVEEGACIDELPPLPECASQAYSICADNTAYWYNSCDELEGVREVCEDTECVGDRCVEPTCSDSTQNGEETDIDCGGSCPGCNPGSECLRDSDCLSLRCSGGTCAEASCTDGITNGSESDIDCGGDVCNACALGDTCESGTDCASGKCENSTCAPSSCGDGELSSGETDIDCGGDCPGCAGGLSCLTNTDCQSNECSNGTCTVFQCPSDMVRIGDRVACIDKYEATVYADASCSGTRYGQSGDDYPSGFPDAVSSDGCEGFCNGNDTVEPSTSPAACSVASVKPSRSITWYQARRACQNAGKVLCTIAQSWNPACRGPNETAYPYGDTEVQQRCNDGWRSLGDTITTGSANECKGPGFASSLFDMSGNLAEWTDSCSGTSDCPVIGGSYENILDLTSCNSRINVDVLSTKADFGFRCCVIGN